MLIWSTASNLEQVANLLCAQDSSASYPQQDEKWVSYLAGLRSTGLVWLTGAVVCLLAASWVQLSVNVDNGWPHNLLQYHYLMPNSCHFRDLTRYCSWVLTHVSTKQRYSKCPDFYIPNYFCNSLNAFPVCRATFAILVFGRSYYSLQRNAQ